MSSTWLERARLFIAGMNIPNDASLKDVKKALREHGSRFHCGTCWGRKAWGKAGREFQRQRGLIPGAPPPSPSEFPAHIHFPFRNMS